MPTPRSQDTEPCLDPAVSQWEYAGRLRVTVVFPPWKRNTPFKTRQVKGTMRTISRRQFSFGLAGLLAAGVARPQSLLREATPAQPAGPFYPRTPPLDDDNDLTQVKGQEGTAQGQISDLSGRVLDVNGTPLARVRVEIWQCDANGRYRHPGDTGSRPLDPGFQGFGHTRSDGSGFYRFRTIRPVAYPGRTPHIHVAVFPEGHTPFVTQLYVENESRNEADFLYRRVPADKRHLVSAEFRERDRPPVRWDARWDIVLGVTPA